MPGAPHLLILGDSISKGQYVQPAITWPALASNWLRDSGFDLQIYTSAVSGETSSRGIERLIFELHSFVPDALFIQFGLNDANYWITEGGRIPRTSLPRFRETLKEMVLRARDSGVAKVSMLTNHKVYKTTIFETCKYSDSKAEYDEAIREVAASMGANLLDLASLTEPLFSEIHVLPAPDLLHLSALGHELYAQLVRDHIIDEVLPALRGSIPQPLESASFSYNADWS